MSTSGSPTPHPNPSLERLNGWIAALRKDGKAAIPANDVSEELLDLIEREIVIAKAPGDAARQQDLDWLRNELLRLYIRRGIVAFFVAAGQNDLPAFLTAHPRFLTDEGVTVAAAAVAARVEAGNPEEEGWLQGQIESLRLAFSVDTIQNRLAYAAWCLGQFSSTSDQRFLNQTIRICLLLTRHAAFVRAEPIVRTQVLLFLGLGWHTRFETMQDLADLDAAVAVFQTAVAEPVDDLAAQARLAERLAVALKARYHARRVPADLTAATTAAQAWCDLLPEGHPDLAAALNTLGVRLRERYDLAKRTEDLEAAIDVLTRTLPLAPPDNRPAAYYNFGLARLDRHEIGRQRADLDAALDAFEKAASEAPPAQASEFTLPLARALARRFAEDGSMPDIDRAIALLEAPAPTKSGDPPWLRLDELGNCCEARFNRTRARPDIDRAVEAFESAAGVASGKSLHATRALRKYGEILLLRLTQFEDLHDLDRAVASFEQGLALAVDDPSEHRALLGDLVGAYRLMHDSYGREEDLERAFELDRRMVPGEHGWTDLELFNRATLLQHRYLHFGATEDLETCIDILERAIDCTSAEEIREDLRTRKALMLRERYRLRANTADLDAAVELSSAVMERTEPDSSDYPERCIVAGQALLTRSFVVGDMRDLDEGIALLEQAMAHPMARPSEQKHAASNCGFALVKRFRRTHAVADVERAVELCLSAVEQTAASASDLASRLGHLGVAYQARYSVTGQARDLDQAIAVFERCLKSASVRQLQYHEYLANLALTLTQRYGVQDNEADLHRAFGLFEQVLQSHQPRGTWLAGVLNGLTIAAQLRFARTGSPADKIHAAKVSRDAARAGAEAGGEVALITARNWARWAFRQGDWSMAADAHRYVQRAIDGIVETQGMRADKESWLGGVTSMAADAAYALARAGDFVSAVEASESGLARLLADALGRDNADVEALRDAHPELCSRFVEARARVAALERADLAPNVGAPRSEQRRRVRMTLDGFIADVRRVSGFETFLAST